MELPKYLISAAAEKSCSIDRALKPIETNSTEELAEHKVPLTMTVPPLLEFADEVLGLGLESVNADLRQPLEMNVRSAAD